MKILPLEMNWFREPRLPGKLRAELETRTQLFCFQAPPELVPKTWRQANSPDLHDPRDPGTERLCMLGQKPILFTERWGLKMRAGSVGEGWL